MATMAGQALWAPNLARAEWCGPTMPQKAGFARGYLFTGVLRAKRPEGQRPPSWEFMVERIWAGEGNVAPPDSPYHMQFEEGKPLTLDDRCYPPYGLRVGGRYLVSIAAMGSFASQSAVVWEVRPHGRVRLLRQYRSKPVATWRTHPVGRRVDPRLLVPTTMRQAVRLMTPPDALPQTDTATAPSFSPSPTRMPLGPGEAPWAQVGGHRSDGSETLYVGTVAGPAHGVITKATEIRVSGPVGGKALAWWRNGGPTTFVLADTADGTRRTVLREPAAVGAGASLDPSGRFVYLAPVEREGRVEGLHRVPVEGGERVRVLGGWDGSVSHMTWSLDGRWLAITGLDGAEVEHRILDPRDGGTMEVHRGDGIRVPVGFLGDELVGYLDRGPERSRQYPLLALDVGRDRVRSLVDGGYGAWADVLPAADGSPVLVYDQPDAENHYTLWTTDGSDEPSLLWSSDQNHTDAASGDFGTSALVETSQSQGVQSPGFVPVFAHGVAYPWPDGPDWTGDQRVMIDMATGEQLPSEAGALQPKAGDPR